MVSRKTLPHLSCEASYSFDINRFEHRQHVLVKVLREAVVAPTILAFPNDNRLFQRISDTLVCNHMLRLGVLQQHMTTISRDLPQRGLLPAKVDIRTRAIP